MPLEPFTVFFQLPWRVWAKDRTKQENRTLKKYLANIVIYSTAIE